MLLLNSGSSTLQWIGILSQMANVVIAAIALGLTLYVFVFRSKREKQQREKDWFHRLVIEPKLDELFSFFQSLEREIKVIDNQLSNKISKFETKRSAHDDIRDAIYEFNRSFIDFIEAVDEDLSSQIRRQLTEFQDHLSQHLFAEDFDQNRFESLKKEFRDIKNDIIHRLYKWNK